MGDLAAGMTAGLDIGEWLTGLGLEQYGVAFRDNDVDERILRSLTADDLKDLGVRSVGHRRRLLDAIAALARDPNPTAEVPTTERTAERRQLTVMFVDLVGSTELASRLDPEEVREVIRLYREAAGAAIQRYEGHLQAYLGDGVMAYFGWPTAHEDAAERAVRTALHLLAAIPNLEAPGHVCIEARVGIATGLVVIGADGRSHDPSAAVGETPNLAARLQGEAPPGGVVVAPTTRRLLGDQFDYQDLGLRRMKGLPEPIAVTQVLRERAATSRFAARSARLTPFVGRAQEVGLLFDRWQLACAGEGQVVVVVGEAGIGKSRIIETFGERLAGEPVTRISYQCSPYHANSALYPAIAQMLHAAGIEAGDAPAVKHDKLEALLRRGRDDIAVDAPLIADLLSIPLEGRHAPLNLMPMERKVKSLAALHNQLLGLAKRQPVLFVLEDAHWIDPSTRELIDLAIEPVARSRMLMLITSRPEFTASWFDQAHVASVRLNRLGQKLSEGLVSRVTGGKALPEAVARAIVARADGVPLFVEELTKAVIESGALRDLGDHYEAIEPVLEVAIPATLQDSLVARFDRLSSVKHIAQIGSAIGREFPFGLVSEVAELTPDALAAALRQLEEAGLVFRRGEPPEATYTFKHALVRDAAHGTLLRARRQVLHGRIGEALESRHPDIAATQPEVLAQHFAEAGAPAKAALHWLEAGRLAYSRSAFREAISHFERGLAKAGEMPSTPARHSLELDLQLGFANTCLASYGYAAAEPEQAFAQARRLVQKIGDDARLARVVSGLYGVYYNRGRHSEGIDIASALLAFGDRQADTTAQCVAHRALAATYSAMGRFDEAWRHGELATQCYDPAASASSVKDYGHDIGVAAFNHLRLPACFLGLPDEAAAAEAKAISLVRRLDHANTLGYERMYRALADLVRRDLERARETCEELIELGERRHMPFWAMMGRAYLGGALAPSDPPRAIQLLERARQERALLRQVMFEPVICCLEGEALMADGQTVKSAMTLEQGIAAATAGEEKWWTPELLRHKARVLLALNGKSARPEAVGVLCEAIEIAKLQHSRVFNLRAASDLAPLLAEAGDRDGARAVLTEACSGLAASTRLPEIDAARRLLAELA